MIQHSMILNKVKFEICENSLIRKCKSDHRQSQHCRYCKTGKKTTQTEEQLLRTERRIK